MGHSKTKAWRTLPSVVQTTVFFFLSKPPIWNPSSASKTLYSSVSGSVICIGGGGNDALSLYSNSSYSSSSSSERLQIYTQLTYFSENTKIQPKPDHSISPSFTYCVACRLIFGFGLVHLALLVNLTCSSSMISSILISSSSFLNSFTS